MITSEVSVSSRLISNLVASCFDHYIPLYCRGSLLDLGCGKAPLYEVYRRHVKEIICSDWVNSCHKLSYIDVFCDLSKPLPFSKGSFDTVIFSDVIEHVFDPGFALTEIYRVLRNNGTLLLSVPFFYWLHEEPYDFFRYTEHALKRLSEECGFEILVLDRYGGALEIIADILAKVMIDWHWKLGPFLSNKIQNFAVFLRRTRKGQEISNFTSKRFPFGYFLVLKKLDFKG